MKSLLFSFGVSVLLGSTAFSEMGDSPEEVGREMKQGELLSVKQGLDRHVIEAEFSNDGFILLTFLDGKVCREMRVRKDDPPQDEYIQRLIAKGRSGGHSWIEMEIAKPNKRWRRDDGLDIMYGGIINKAPTIKHALCVTAPEFIKYLERVVKNNGADIAGTCPSLEQVRAGIAAGMRP